MVSNTPSQRSSRSVFRACTLRQESGSFSGSIIRRQNLEKLLHQWHSDGRNLVVVGPAGSGKSILALQAALDQTKSFQYVSARGLPEELNAQSEPPNALGDVVANIANLLLHPDEHHVPSRLEDLLDHLSGLAGDDSLTLVIDDLDLISHHDTPASALAAQTFSQLTNVSIVWVSRSGYEPIANFLNHRVPVRVIGFNLLTIQPGELPTLIEAGSFGEASHSEIETAFKSIGGWFVGVQLMLDAKRLGESVLDDLVLNELILGAPRAVQDVIIALSRVPYLTHDFVNHLLPDSGSGTTTASAILNRLPTISAGYTSDRVPMLRLPVPLVESIGRLAILIGDADNVSAISKRAITWYLEHEDYLTAKQFAIASGYGVHYVDAVKPHCAVLAAEEQWVQIRDLLTGGPEALIFKDSDLAFWYMKGSSYTGDWETVTRIRHAVLGPWLESDDPMEKGRALLIDAWRHWTQSRAEEALQQATQSYEVLPPEALQDRLWAAIAAENASRNMGDQALMKMWSSRTGGFGTYMTQSPEFWHMNCGFHRLNHLAMMGKLNHARDLAGISMVQAPEKFPHSRFRYLLLRAYIDIETSDMDSARETLDLAAKHAIYPPITSQLEIATASYFLQSGDLEQAARALALDDAGRPSRPDHYLHRIRLLADIRLAAGEVDIAYDILTNWCRGEEQWPKYFGEPHHHLLLARVRLQLGSIQEANGSAQYVINEALRRNHQFYLVQAYAVQAECQHRLGRSDKRDERINQALKADQPQGASVSFSPLGTDVRTLLNTIAPATGGYANQPESAFVNPQSVLTPRETELLHAVAGGMSTREIAEWYFISPSTVKNHLTSVFRKLGVNSRREAIEIVFPLRNISDDNTSRSQ